MDRTDLSIYVTHLWTNVVHAHLKELCSFQRSSDSEHKWREYMEKKFGAIRPLQVPVSSPEQFQRAVEKPQDVQVPFSEQLTLAEIWRIQAMIWDTFEERIGDQQTPAPGTRSLLPERHEFVHVVALLEQRMAEAECEDERTVDKYLVKLLRRTVNALPSRCEEAAHCAAEWLHDPALPFLSSDVFWPVPDFARFLKGPKRKIVKPKSKTKINPLPSSERACLIVSNIATLITTKLLPLYPLDDCMQLFVTLVKEWLKVQQPDEQSQELARAVTFFYRHRDSFGDRAEDGRWSIGLCRSLFSLLLPDAEVIPGIKADGTADFDSVESTEIIVEESKNEAKDIPGSGDLRVDFGIRNRQKPSVLLKLTPDERSIWKDWVIAEKTDDQVLRSQFSVQKLKRCQGIAIEPLKHFCKSYLNSIEGAHWFDNLVRSSRNNSASRPRLKTFLEVAGLQVCPPLDPDTGRAVMPQALGEYVNATQLLSGIDEPVSDIKITEVHKYSWEPRSAFFTYSEPPPKAFTDFFSAATSLNIAAECKEALQKIKMLQQEQSHPAVNDLAREFQMLANKISRATKQPRDFADGNLALMALAKLGTMTSTKFTVLPQSYQFGRSCRTLNQDEFDIEYGYSLSDLGDIHAVESFGVRGSEFPLKGRIIASAGPEVEGYAEAVVASAKIPAPIDAQELKQLLLQLPLAEATQAARGEDIYARLFTNLWPNVINSEAAVLSQSRECVQIRDWLCRAVDLRNLFRVIIPKEGDYVMEGKWRKGETYEERNPNNVVSPEHIESFVRPLLTYKGTGNVREKAIIYVTN